MNTRRFLCGLRLVAPSARNRCELWLLAALVAAALHPALRAGEPATAAAKGEQARQADPAEDPLLRLNAVFRATYAQTRGELLAHNGPVVLVEGDDLVLLNQGARTQAEVTPPLYHALKSVAHVPLAVYLLLVPAAGPTDSLDEPRLARLADLRLLVASARDRLAEHPWPEGGLARQQRILDDALAMLDNTAGAKRIRHEDLLAFTRRAGPLVLENCRDAARAKIDALDAQMRGWRKQLSADDWGRLRVVVTGAHMPRQGNLAMQYFQKLLGGQPDPRRLIYCEGLYEEPQAVNLLGTVVLDTGIGDAFFADELRMHRDLLSDAAAEYLRTLAIEP